MVKELSFVLMDRGYDNCINNSTLIVTYNGMQIEVVKGAYYIKQGKRNVLSVQHYKAP